MATNYTPITNGAPATAASVNAPLQELDDAIENMKDGSAALSAPTISSFANAQHDHEDAAGGSLLTMDAIDTTGADNDDLYYADGAGGGAWSPRPGALPTGVVLPYAGASAPTSWLLCDGSAVSRATYATLYTLIGTTYGIGDGSTTFNVPDLRGRIPGGKDNMGGVSANRITDAQADSLGGSMGAETHPLTTAEMPAHHHHIRYRANQGNSSTWMTISNRPISYQSTMNLDEAIEASNASAAGDYISSEGSGGSHNNVQPTIFLNYIIKT